jgi:hypothetical protein
MLRDEIFPQPQERRRKEHTMSSFTLFSRFLLEEREKNNFAERIFPTDHTEKDLFPSRSRPDTP